MYVTWGDELFCHVHYVMLSCALYVTFFHVVLFILFYVGYYHLRVRCGVV